MRSLVPAALILAFTVYCVVDVVRSDSSDVRGLPKTVWVLLCLLFPLAGGIAWLLAGRPRATGLPGTARLRTPRPPAVGPDDDPDFLRTIDRPRPVRPAEPLPPKEARETVEPAEQPGQRPVEDGSARGQGGADGDGSQDDGDTGPGTPAGTDDRRP